MKGTLSHGSARLVERLVSFFLLPILTKIITPAEYAIWSQTIIIAGLLTSVISLKFESSIIKFYPTWNNQKKKKDSIMLFILTSTLVLFFLVSIIALVFDEKISQLIFGDRQLTMYIPLIIGLLFSELLFDHLWVMLRISNRVNKLSIYIIIKAIWRLAIITLVLIGVNGNFYYAFWSFVLFQICIMLCLFLWDIEVLSILKAGFKKGRSSWAKILKFSLPLVAFIILLGINNFADRIFIANFLGLDSLASYNAGFSLAQLITFFYATISFMLYPELSKNIGKKTKISNLIKKVMTAYLALTMPFLVFIGLAGTDILLVLTTNEYLISSQTLFLISLNIAIFGFFQINYFIVLLERGSINAPIIMLFVAGINILSNFVLVPKIGILGAALSGFFSNSVLAIIVYKMSQNILKNNFPFIVFFKILIRSLIMGVVIWLVMNWLGNDIISLVVIIIIAGLIYILLDFFGSKNSSFISITKIDSFLK